MQKLFGKTQYTLSAGTIDVVADAIMEYCTRIKVERKTALRYRLAAEECLGKWLSRAAEGEVPTVTLEMTHRLFKPCIRLSVDGEQYNPYLEQEETQDFGRGSEDFLLRLGVIPEYAYKKGENTLFFALQKKPKNQLLMLLFLIACAVFVGVLGQAAVPDAVTAFLSETIVTPVEDAFFNILSAIAGPMIFLSVAWGVYGIGDVETLGRIGKKLMVSFLAVVLCFAAFGTLFYGFLGLRMADAAGGVSQFSKIFEMILGIFPKNFFSPFIEGNTLQIIFLAFIIGLSLIFLGQRTSSVARAVEQINHIINFLMEFISKLVPVFVFIVLVNIIWQDSFAVFSVVWKFTFVFIAAAFTAHAAFLIFTSVRCRQNPLVLLRSILPSYLIALSTASSSAAFESNIKICNTKFAIRKELSSFSVPFGTVIFKPTTALYYLLLCLYFANVYDVPFTFGLLVSTVLVTALSAIATPPIPGGAAATYTILFLQVGIPADALAIALAVDMIFDFLLTSGDMYMLLLEILCISEKTGMHERRSAR